MRGIWSPATRSSAGAEVGEHFFLSYSTVDGAAFALSLADKLVADYLRTPGLRMTTVVGRGGVGKTALVCRLLKALETGRLPDDLGELDVDGIVYLSPVGAHPVNFPNLFADLCRLLPDEVAERLRQRARDPRQTPAELMLVLRTLLTAPDALLARARDRTRGFPRALEALAAILAVDRDTTLPELLADTEQLPDNVVHALVGYAAASVLHDIDFDYLMLWGHYQLTIDLHQRLYGHLPNSRTKVTHLKNLGLCHTELGQIPTAFGHHHQGLEIARQIGDREGELHNLGALGDCYATLGQTTTAIQHYKKALTIALDIGDREGEAIWLGNLGNCYAALGQIKIATDHHQKALIAQDICDQEGNADYRGGNG